MIIWMLAPQERGRPPWERHLVFASWDGAALRPLPQARLPWIDPSCGRPQAAAICEHPERGIIAFLPEDQRLYELVRGEFVPFDGPTPAAGAKAARAHTLLAELADLPIEPPLPQESSPPWFEDVSAAYDPTDDRLVLGPGNYLQDQGAYVSPRRRHQLVTRQAGQWSRITSELSPPADDHNMQLFFGGNSGPLVLDATHAVRRLDPRAGWVVCTERRDHRLKVAVIGPEDLPYAVSEAGEVQRLHRAADGRLQWQALSPKVTLSAEVSGALNPKGAVYQRAATYDRARDRIVVWSQPLDYDEGACTAIWDDGKWSGSVSAKAHPDALLTRPKSTIRLVYDKSQSRVLRLSASQVSALHEDGWRALPMDPVFAAVHPEFREVVVDPTSGQILILDLEERLVIAFHTSGCAVIGAYSWPEGFRVRSRPRLGHPGFPFDQVGFCARTRSLRTHSTHDDHANYALDLGPYFDAAARSGR